jgi:hypothetical protein
MAWQSHAQYSGVEIMYFSAPLPVVSGTGRARDRETGDGECDAYPTGKRSWRKCPEGIFDWRLSAEQEYEKPSVDGSHLDTYEHIIAIVADALPLEKFQRGDIAAAPFTSMLVAMKVIHRVTELAVPLTADIAVMQRFMVSLASVAEMIAPVPVVLRQTFRTESLATGGTDERLLKVAPTNVAEVFRSVLVVAGKALRTTLFPTGFAHIECFEPVMADIALFIEQLLDRFGEDTHHFFSCFRFMKLVINLSIFLSRKKAVFWAIC